MNPLMEKNMSVQQEILHLMTERIRVLSRLKDLYLKKQKLVVDPHKDGLDKLAVVQRSCMEDMLNLESGWRSLVGKLKTFSRVSSDQTDIIISLSLKDEAATEYFAYRDQLHQIVSEIERIKRNNDLLAQNSIPLTPRKNRVEMHRQKITTRSGQPLLPLHHPVPKNRSK